MKSVYCRLSSRRLLAVAPGPRIGNLDGVWSVRDEFVVTTCVSGKCVTAPQIADRSVTIVQERPSISLDVAWVNPLTGEILFLPRVATVSCNEVTFTAPPPLTPGRDLQHQLDRVLRRSHQ